MKNTRATITRLITAIKNKLPEGDDIFSFEGISRQILADALEDSYNLLYDLDTYRESYEIVLLKQTIQRHVTKASKIFSEEDKQAYFGIFLIEFEQLRIRIRETYLILTEDSFRDEQEIIAIREKLKEMDSHIDTYNQEDQKIKEILTSINESNSRITEIDNNVSGGAEKIQELLDTATANHNKIAEIHTNTSTWNTEVENSANQLNNLKSEYETQSQRVNSLASKAEQQTVSVEKIEAELLSQKKTADKQLEMIREIVDDANRVGMAGSFKARKDELKAPVRFAEGFMNFSLIVVASVSFYIIFPEISSASIDYKSILIKLPILFPLYWISWSLSRKFAYLTRIREDYSYKYATAMAFEGYSEHTDEDSELYTKLLSLSIDTFGSNPIRLYNLKNVHSSPLHETIASAKGLISQIMSKGKKEEDSDSEE